MEDTKRNYSNLAKQIFTSQLSAPDAKFDHRVLEAQIKNVISSAPAISSETVEADADFRDLNLRDWHTSVSKTGCRTFVVAVSTRGLGKQAALLRSYGVPWAGPFSGKIWEAARATSAAPTCFEPIEVNGIKYGDGALGYNNPTRLAINEAHDLWPERPIGCLVSLGTGEEDPNQLVEKGRIPAPTKLHRVFRAAAPGAAFQLEVAKYCAASMTSCAKTHQDILASLDRDQLRNKYFRINVPGMGKIKLAEWEMMGDMIALAADHMETREMRDEKSRIAKALLESTLAESEKQKCAEPPVQSRNTQDIKAMGAVNSRSDAWSDLSQRATSSGTMSH